MMVYISIGSNLGNKEQNLQRACELLANKVGTIIRSSEYFYSEPWGFVSDNSFVNQCIAIDTELSPIDLLHTTQQIEIEMGREHKSKDGIYHDRIIDIDLLKYFNKDFSEYTITSEKLTLPHPLMSQRDFVMIPLKEIFEDF